MAKMNKEKAKAKEMNTRHTGERGRPTAYSEEYCQKLIDHMAQGLSFDSFAGTIGVTRETMYNWAKKHTNFFHAKKKGQAYCLLFWEKLGLAGIMGQGFKDPQTGKRNPLKFGQAVYIFNMKNRFGWRDRVEHMGEIGTTNDEKDRISRLMANPMAAAKIAEAAELLSLDEEEGLD